MTRMRLRRLAFGRVCTLIIKNSPSHLWVVRIGAAHMQPLLIPNGLNHADVIPPTCPSLRMRNDIVKILLSHLGIMRIGAAHIQPLPIPNGLNDPNMVATIVGL
jgi:hypothetical protein